MQFGSGWWFLDQKDGMQKPLLLFIKDYFIEKNRIRWEKFVQSRKHYIFALLVIRQLTTHKLIKLSR